MTHAYLTEQAIKKAVTNHEITQLEADKLMKKIDCQVLIYKATHI